MDPKDGQQPQPEEKKPEQQQEQLESMFTDFFSQDIGDVIIQLTLPGVDLAVGGKRTVSFQRRMSCEKCEGRGRTSTDEKSPACDACERGFTKVDASVDVDIPPGAGAGMQIRVRSQGHVRKGKPQGDVVIVLGRQPTEESGFSSSRASTMLFLFLVAAVLIYFVLSMR